MKRPLNEARTMNSEPANPRFAGRSTAKLEEYFAERFLVIKLNQEKGQGKKMPQYQRLVLIYDFADENQWFVSADISPAALMIALRDGSRFINYKGNKYIPLPTIEEVGGRLDNIRQIIATNIKNLQHSLGS